MKRIWIYQAGRFFTDQEKSYVQDALDDFLEGWTAHGTKLAGKAEIWYDLFIVLQVDLSVANATGCSIDKSVHLLKDIEQALGIPLFNRLDVAYRDRDGSIKIADRAQFTHLVENGTITADTIVFNNMVSDADSFPQHWEIPFSESWHAKVFKP